MQYVYEWWPIKTCHFTFDNDLLNCLDRDEILCIHVHIYLEQLQRDKTKVEKTFSVNKRSILL